MDWTDYRTIAARPDVLPRELIRWTVSAVAGDQAIVDALTEVLRGEPVRRPVDAVADPRVDLFLLALPVETVTRIIAQLARSEAGPSGRLRHAQIVWGEYLGLLEQENHMSAQDTVNRLMQGFDSRDVEAIAACFAEDAIYHNIPMQPVKGMVAIKAAVAPFIAMASTVRFEVLRSVASGNIVMNERVDHFTIGGKQISIAVMGVFEVGPNGITAWRDYFDLAQFQSQMPTG